MENIDGNWYNAQLKWQPADANHTTEWRWEPVASMGMVGGMAQMVNKPQTGEATMFDTWLDRAARTYEEQVLQTRVQRLQRADGRRTPRQEQHGRTRDGVASNTTVSGSGSRR